MNNRGRLDHEHADIVGLLGGQIGRTETLVCARHLRSCRDCTDELVDVAVAHAALTSAARTESDLGAPGVSNVNVSLVDSAPDVARSERASLPAVTLRTEESASKPPGPWRGRFSIVAAAAAVVAFGTVGITTLRSSHSSVQPVVARAALEPLNAPASTGGLVTVSADKSVRDLTVHTRALAHPPAQHFYEVWLLDPSTQKMLPMGVLSPSGTGSYAVSASIMDGYSAVDVSLQANDGNPAHSQTSVLRASYGPATA
jgi:hypothetical protein